MILEQSNFSFAKIRRNGIEGFGTDIQLWCFNLFPILNIVATNLRQCASVRPISRDELRDNRDFLGAVDSAALSEKVLVAQAVSLNITTVLVTHAFEAVIILVTAVVTLTTRMTINAASMRGVCGADAVRFPYVHLCAA